MMQQGLLLILKGFYAGGKLSTGVWNLKSDGNNSAALGNNSLYD